MNMEVRGQRSEKDDPAPSRCENTTVSQITSGSADPIISWSKCSAGRFRNGNLTASVLQGHKGQTISNWFPEHHSLKLYSSDFVFYFAAAAQAGWWLLPQIRA